MSDGDPTFGCGTFLPGGGPGNFNDFDGGGTIDSGGGGDPPDPPDPPDDVGGGVVIGDGGGGVPPSPGPPSIRPPDPPTGGGGGGISPGAPKPGQPGGPGGVGGGGGGGAAPGAPVASCKCIITSFTQSKKKEENGLCLITLTLIRTCVPSDTPEAGWRTARDLLIAAGYAGGQGSMGVGQPCSCGSNTCGESVLVFSKRCPGGGGGGAAPGAPPAGTAGGALFGGEGGEGGASPGAPKAGTAGAGLADGGGGGGAAPGAPRADQGGSTAFDGISSDPGGGTRTNFTGSADKGTVYDTGGGSIGGGTGVDFDGLAGGAIAFESQLDSGSLISATIQSGEIDLNDPTLVAAILRKKPAGVEDPEVGFNTSPPYPTLVTNYKNTDLFKDKIDSNIEYILSNKRGVGNWDSTRSGGVTPTTIYDSLKPNIQTLLGDIRNYDGTPLSRNQIFSMIGTRVLDGTISKITLKYLQDLAKSSKKRNPIVIKRSNNNKVNEVAALALVDRNKFTLDPSKAQGVMQNILPNWKTLASDIDKYIEVTIGGEVRKYYVKDDDTFIDRTTLGISDGDYFDVIVGDGSVRLYTKSEKDHAFLLPESTRQKAISLLGGSPGRTLEVQANILSGIEFDYSLSAPRQDFYVLSCVLSSIDTKPSTGGSFLLKDTTAQYALTDTSSSQGLRDVNAYIKYKANHRVFMLDDEDLMLDYITATSAVTLKQTDILFDSPKENKSIPLLTRQIPWYIMVYPTNRSDINIFNSKSKIISLAASSDVGRSLSCRTTIVPQFSKQQTNKFIRVQTDGRSAVDVYGTHNPQTRITQINPTDKVFTTGYSEGGSFVSAEKYTPSRKKTGLRLLKEIITEMDTNYLLGLNGIGKSLTEFDVYSRLTLQQFNLLSRLESFRIIQASIRNGIVADVKVVPPINRADKRISFQKTQLVRRRVGAPTDTFTPIKGTRNGETIVPPTTTGESTFAPVRR